MLLFFLTSLLNFLFAPFIKFPASSDLHRTFLPPRIRRVDIPGSLFRGAAISCGSYKASKRECGGRRRQIPSILPIRRSPRISRTLQYSRLVNLTRCSASLYIGGQGRPYGDDTTPISAIWTSEQPTDSHRRWDFGNQTEVLWQILPDSTTKDSLRGYFNAVVISATSYFRESKCLTTGVIIART